MPPRETSRNFHGGGSPYMLYNMESCLTMAIDELFAMWPYTCMILSFYSTLAMFCDAIMNIYDDSTALESHSC